MCYVAQGRAKMEIKHDQQSPEITTTENTCMKNMYWRAQKKQNGPKQ